MTDPRPDDCVDLPYNVTWDKANCPKLEVPIGAQVCQPIEPGPNPPVPPLPCPVNPLYYEYVRWVGKLVTTGDGATMYNQAGDVITDYTSPWFRKQTNTGDEFVYLGGMYIKYGPYYAYRWRIGDHAFDPNDPDFNSNINSAWQPYYKWNNAEGLPHPWRASYKAQASNYSGSDFYRMPIGDLGSNGYVMKTNAEPWNTNAYLSVYPNLPQSGNYTGSYELQGHWEFSNDGVTPIGKWSGTDDNGLDRDCDPQPPGNCQEVDIAGDLHCWAYNTQTGNTEGEVITGNVVKITDTYLVTTANGYIYSHCNVVYADGSSGNGVNFGGGNSLLTPDQPYWTYYWYIVPPTGGNCLNP